MIQPARSTKSRVSRAKDIDVAGAPRASQRTATVTPTAWAVTQNATRTDAATSLRTMKIAPASPSGAPLQYPNPSLVYIRG